jgi:hypothetical protein
MDCILISRYKFDKKALDEGLVRDTWSGLLEDKEGLPDQWTRATGVLVGKRFFKEERRRNG